MSFCLCCILQIQLHSDGLERCKEYIKRLNESSSTLQSELLATNETLKHVEKEKLAVVENLSATSGHHTSLQEQLTSLRVNSFVSLSNLGMEC